MDRVMVVRTDGILREYTITNQPKNFLKEVYGLIGNGCDFVEAVKLDYGVYLLVDEEPFRRNPEPEENPTLGWMLQTFGNRGVRVKGAGVFVGETPEGDDLAGLSEHQLAIVKAAHDTVQRIAH